MAEIKAKIETFMAERKEQKKKEVSSYVIFVVDYFPYIILSGCLAGRERPFGC
jgi:hypothetical protein